MVDCSSYRQTYITYAAVVVDVNFHGKHKQWMFTCKISLASTDEEKAHSIRCGIDEQGEHSGIYLDSFAKVSGGVTH